MKCTYEICEHLDQEGLKTFRKAQHVIAFKGLKMFILKSRDHHEDLLLEPPPDEVIAYLTGKEGEYGRGLRRLRTGKLEEK